MREVFWYIAYLIVAGFVMYIIMCLGMMFCEKTKLGAFLYMIMMWVTILIAFAVCIAIFCLLCMWLS